VQESNSFFEEVITHPLTFYGHCFLINNRYAELVIGKSGKSSVGWTVSDDVFTDGKDYAGKSADLVVNELLMHGTFIVVDPRCIFTERRNSAQRTASEAEVDDILELMDTFDNLNILSSVQFVARQYDQLPGYGPEEVNILTVVERQAVTDQSIAALSSKVDRLSNIDDASRLKVDNTQILAAIDTINTQFRNLAQHARPSADENTGKKTYNEDRLRNVVITGITEKR